jgi:Domain of unknown function (DUF4382)
MPMKRTRLWAIGIGALVILGGVAAYLFLYEGSVAISVKDASGAWSHVFVTFSAVDIHRSGMDAATWDHLSLGTRTVDLAVLTNVSELLGTARLTPGHYEQIRLNVSSATGVDLTGKSWTLNVTNGEAKIVQQFDIRSGAQTNILVDIDLSRCIVGTQATGYSFTPVIGNVTVG